MLKFRYLTNEELQLEYKNKFGENFENKDGYKIATTLLQVFPKVEIAEGFPNSLITDNFDLMLEVFANWDYSKISNEEINGLCNFLEFLFNKQIKEDNISAVFYGISTYIPKEKLSVLVNQFKPKTKDFWQRNNK